MSADLEQLLREAAGTPRRELDLDGLEATVRRRRLRRRAGTALAAVIALAAVAVALPALLQPRVIIDTPAEPDGWPVLVRYVETRVDDGQAFEWEVGARGWTSWTMVRARAFNLDDAGEPVDPSPEGLALAREGEDRWAGTTYFLDEDDREGPFDLVAEALAGAWAERYALEEHPDGQDAWLPLDPFVATPARPDDAPGDELVAADMPALRGEVAERLGLDPDDLVAFTIERDDGIHVTWVRHAASGLPLFYEEGMGGPPSIEDGAAADIRVRVDATDVRFDAELPEPTPLEPDPDVPPDEQTGVDEPEGPETAAAGDWRMLPDAPVPGRQNTGGVWTGDELLVWGGVPRAAGAAYDPESDAWRALPEAPLDPREWHVTVWTGSELIIWGGSAYEEPDDPDDACPEDPPPAPYTDRDEIPEVHVRNVDCVTFRNIALGFTDGTYRPALPVSRDQMASFLARLYATRDPWEAARFACRVGVRALRGVHPTTYVLHSFMDARDVAPAWALLQRGIVATDPRLRATQERLQACAYGMGHPERDEVVPACVQHSVLDEQENARLGTLLPLHPRLEQAEVCSHHQVPERAADIDRYDRKAREQTGEGGDNKQHGRRGAMWGEEPSHAPDVRAGGAQP